MSLQSKARISNSYLIFDTLYKSIISQNNLLILSLNSEPNLYNGIFILSLFKIKSTGTTDLDPATADISKTAYIVIKEKLVPWNEYKKAIIDFAIALVTALTYVNFNGSTLEILCLNLSIDLPAWLFVILAVVLIWVAINVVKCTDGVDGLCGSLSIITLLGFYAVLLITNTADDVAQSILVMISCILGYLWFNASPSRLLMGDAGSRALGIFIAIVTLKTGAALLFIPLAIVFILDGGLGLIKVSLLRFLKIHILKNTRTPLHDHARKNKGWSDTQTVFRFMILQIVVVCVTIGLIL